jgi:IS30 family transposase
MMSTSGGTSNQPRRNGVQRGFQPNEELKARIHTLRNVKHWSHRKIGDEIGVKASTVRNFLTRENLPNPEPGVKTPRGSHVTAAGYDRVHELNRQGLGPAAIARTIGIPKETVTDVLRRGPESYNKRG